MRETKFPQFSLGGQSNIRGIGKKKYFVITHRLICFFFSPSKVFATGYREAQAWDVPGGVPVVGGPHHVGLGHGIAALGSTFSSHGRRSLQWISGKYKDLSAEICFKKTGDLKKKMSVLQENGGNRR